MLEPSLLPPLDLVLIIKLLAAYAILFVALCFWVVKMPKSSYILKAFLAIPLSWGISFVISYLQLPSLAGSGIISIIAPSILLGIFIASTCEKKVQTRAFILTFILTAIIPLATTVSLLALH